MPSRGSGLEFRMLPRNQRMELLSKAYVRAVAAQAGCACDDLESDFGIDLTIRGIIWENNRFIDEGGVLEIQLKSTTMAGVRRRNEQFHYALSVRNYEHLRKVIKNRPARLLVLYVMPENEEEWLVQQQQGISLHHCCYYLSLEGFPSTGNQNSVTVAIPETNVFSVSYLQQILFNK
jgi:hypothetical protein